jgi:hypothetical protein
MPGWTSDPAPPAGEHPDPPLADQHRPAREPLPQAVLETQDGPLSAYGAYFVLVGVGVAEGVVVGFVGVADGVAADGVTDGVADGVAADGCSNVE